MFKDNLWNFSEFESWPKYMFPADTWLNNNVIITSNNVATLGRRNNDVIIRITLFVRIMKNVTTYYSLMIAYRCLSGKLWYLQHIGDGDTIAYH